MAASLKRGALAAALFAAAAASGGWAAGGAPLVPDHQVFEALLAYAEEARFDRLEKLLPHAERAGAGAARRFGAGGGAALSEAIAGRDLRAAKAAVHRLIFLHMRDLLETASEEPERAALSVRLAFLDFRLLAPVLRERDAPAVDKAEEAYKAAYRALKGGGDAGRAEMKESLAEVVRLCKEALDGGH